MNNENMKFWNQVCETDPAITKHISIRGGFTSIDAQSQIKLATEQWGMYGSTWGLKDFNFEVIRDGENKPVCLALDATFWYPGGSFPISVDMAWETKDLRKKLVTDATTKSLSKLGFNSDVFEGRFDDNQYVEEQNKKFGHNPPVNANNIAGMGQNNTPNAGQGVTTKIAIPGLNKG